VQCLHRWQKVLNPELIKGPWTPEVRPAPDAGPRRQLQQSAQLASNATAPARRRGRSARRAARRRMRRLWTW